MEPHSFYPPPLGWGEQKSGTFKKGGVAEGQKKEGLTKRGGGDFQKGGETISITSDAIFQKTYHEFPKILACGGLYTIT